MTVLNGSVIANSAALVANTGALIASAAGSTAAGAGGLLSAVTTGLGLLGFQEGGYVAGTGAAVVHAGETIANPMMLQRVGEGLADVTMPGGGGAAGAAGMTTANAHLSDIGKKLSAGGATTTLTHAITNVAEAPNISFDGAVFHGAPSPQYVQQLLNQATTQLRASSRRWSFGSGSGV
jgi:hypothetical protein